MAVKQRDPSAAGRKQIESKFKKLFEEKVEFISIKEIKSWYGRFDEAAVEKLKLAWQDHWKSKDWKPKAVPKLFAVGPTSRPKGYVFGRKDKQKDWFHDLNA